MIVRFTTPRGSEVVITTRGKDNAQGQRGARAFLLDQLLVLAKDRAPDPGHRWAECLCKEIDPSDRPCMICVERRGPANSRSAARLAGRLRERQVRPPAGRAVPGLSPVVATRKAVH